MKRGRKNIAWFIYYLECTLLPPPHQNTKIKNFFFLHFLCILFPLVCSLKFKNGFVSQWLRFICLPVRGYSCTWWDNGGGGEKNRELLACHTGSQWLSRNLKLCQLGCQRGLEPQDSHLPMACFPTQTNPDLWKSLEFRHEACSY